MILPDRHGFVYSCRNDLAGHLSFCLPVLSTVKRTLWVMGVGTLTVVLAPPIASVNLAPTATTRLPCARRMQASPLSDQRSCSGRLQGRLF